jgi:topoisomerase IA-like protein
MPFKSKAQRRKFAQLLVEGKITDEQYEEWNRSTGKKALPERLHPKASVKKSRSRKTTAKKTTSRKTTAKKTRPRKTTAKKRPSK